MQQFERDFVGIFCFHTFKSDLNSGNWAGLFLFIMTTLNLNLSHHDLALYLCRDFKYSETSLKRDSVYMLYKGQIISAILG